MRRKDCVKDCVGPDCEGCGDYKTSNQRTMKTAEEVRIEIVQCFATWKHGNMTFDEYYQEATNILESYAKEHAIEFVKDNLDHWRTFETSEDVTAFLDEIYDEWITPK